MAHTDRLQTIFFFMKIEEKDCIARMRPSEKKAVISLSSSIKVSETITNGMDFT